jgi:hypothetical protein
MGFPGAQPRKDVQTTLECSLNDGDGTEERDYNLPPPQRRVPTTDPLRDHFSHHIHNQQTALGPSEVDAVPTYPLLLRTKRLLHRLFQYASASDAYRPAVLPAGQIIIRVQR